MTLAETLDLVNKGGVIVLLLLLPIGVHRKWIVPGWLYVESRQECREWKTIALKGIGLAKQLGAQDESPS